MPTDINDIGKEKRLVLAIVCALAISRISSVIIRIRPELTSASLNRAIARTSARVNWLPCPGIILGVRAGIIEIIVSVSFVSGETTCASPANTMSPVTPSVLAIKRSWSFRWALVSRFGLTSTAYIDFVRSNKMTRASLRSCSGRSVFCHAGPAMAMMARHQQTIIKERGLLLISLFRSSIK